MQKTMYRFIAAKFSPEIGAHYGINEQDSVWNKTVGYISKKDVIEYNNLQDIKLISTVLVVSYQNPVLPQRNSL